MAAVLQVIPRFEALVPENLGLQIQSLQISTLFLTTALFNECIRIQPDIFLDGAVLFGGEIWRPRGFGSIEEGPQRGLFHVYGPTETTTFADFH